MRNYADSFYSGVGRAAFVLTLLFGAALLGGCSGAEPREEVWVEMIPGSRYTFETPRGYIDGDTLVVRGKVERRGYFDDHWADLVVIGTDQNGEKAVEQEAAVRMTRRKQSFVVRVPYQPDLDWTISVREGGGLLQDAARKIISY